MATIDLTAETFGPTVTADGFALVDLYDDQVVSTPVFLDRGAGVNPPVTHAEALERTP